MWEENNVDPFRPASQLNLDSFQVKIASQISWLCSLAVERRDFGRPSFYPPLTGAYISSTQVGYRRLKVGGEGLESIGTGHANRSSTSIEQNRTDGLLVCVCCELASFVTSSVDKFIKSKKHRLLIGFHKYICILESWEKKTLVSFFYFIAVVTVLDISERYWIDNWNSLSDDIIGTPPFKQGTMETSHKVYRITCSIYILMENWIRPCGIDKENIFKKEKEASINNSK